MKYSQVFGILGGALESSIRANVPARKTQMRIYTGGTFDLFHRGHLEFLRSIAQLGDVIVSLNSDEFIAAYKGRPPIMTFDERKAVLEGCRYVAEVIENVGGSDSKVAILQSAADVVAIGSDWARRDYYAQMQFTQDWLDEKGIWLLYVPYTKGVSSTDVKKRMEAFLREAAVI